MTDDLNQFPPIEFGVKNKPAPTALPDQGGFPTIEFGKKPAPKPTIAAPTETTEVPVVSGMGDVTGYTQTVPVEKERKAEELPSWGEIAPMPAGTTWALGLALDGKARKDILQNTFPDAKFGADKYGNPTIEHKGQKYLIDQPGVSASDVASFGMKTAAGIPLAAAAAFAAPVESVGVPLAAAASALGMGAQDVLSQIYTRIYGNKQPYDVLSTGLNTALGAAGPIVSNELSAYAHLMNPDMFNTLPIGVQNFLLRFTRNQRERGFFPEKSMPNSIYTTDALLDNPEFKGMAGEIMKSDSPAADFINGFLQNRQAGTQARLMDDMNRNFGSLTQSERELDAALKADRKTFSSDLQTVLGQAGPVDISNVVSTIDNLIADHPPGTDIGAALRKIRSNLTTSGTPGTPRTPIVDPRSGNIIRYDAGTPSTPSGTVSDPAILENMRSYIDRMINYGDSSIGIVPKSLSKDAAIGSVRRELSSALKSQIPGYSDIMDKYAGNYGQLEANELGADLFTKGKNALRPDEVSAILQNPNSPEAKAFLIGTRSAIENQIRQNPNDMSALKKILAGEDDYQRQNLAAIYGGDSVDNLLASIDRENAYQGTSRSLQPQREASREAAGSTFYRGRETPLLPEAPFSQETVTRPINKAIESFRSEIGPEFEQGLSDILTRQGPEVGATREALKRAQGERDRAKFLQAMIAASHPQGAAEDFRSEYNLPNFGLLGGQRDRYAHAAGGKVGLTADGLLRDLKRRKVMIANHTEQMLALPDDAVVQALEVAKR
jgi:hypothetical protein